MSEYTPTTEEVFEAVSLVWCMSMSRQEAVRAYYRWFNSVRADELEELVEEYDRVFANSAIVKMASPEIYWAGTEDAVKHLFQKTRSRIKKYRTGDD